MKFTIELPIPDQLTPNGRIYPKAVLCKAIEEFNEKAGKSLVVSGFRSLHTGAQPSKVSLNDVVGILKNMELKDRVQIEIELLDTPQGKKIQELIKSGAKVTANMVGNGTLNDNVVLDYSINYVSLDYDPKND